MTKKNTFSVAQHVKQKQRDCINRLRLFAFPHTILHRERSQIEMKFTDFMFSFCRQLRRWWQHVAGNIELVYETVRNWLGEEFCGKCNFRSVHLQYYLHSMAPMMESRQEIITECAEIATVGAIAEIATVGAISGNLRHVKAKSFALTYQKDSRSIIGDMTAAGGSRARGSFALSRTPSRHVNCRTWCRP